jgi:2-methylcitrate dehydratase PrpD
MPELPRSWPDFRDALSWRLASFVRRVRRSKRGGSDQREPADTVFSEMADWIIGASELELDKETIHQTKRVIFDALVSMLAGIATQEGRSILRSCEQSAGHGSCMVPGLPGEVPAGHAAFSVAALTQVHDANDGHSTAGRRGGAWHPGRVIVPTALALAQEAKLTGTDFLKAVAVGYDIALRTFHGPGGSPSDAYGAAAVAGYALKFQRAPMAFALRLAGFSARRSAVEDFETNNLTCAAQARAGVESCLLVSAGYPVMSAPFLRTPHFAFERPESLGEDLQSVYFKPYPSCRATHHCIDAALALRPRVKNRLQDIQKIRVQIPKEWSGPARRVGAGHYYKSYAFSTPYAIAASLVDGIFGLRQLEPKRTDDPLIQSLQARMAIIRRPTSFYTRRNRPISATVVLMLSDGSQYSETVAIAHGAAEDPLSDEEMANKLVNWLSVSANEAVLLRTAVESIDASTSRCDQEPLEELLGATDRLARVLLSRR